MSRRGGLPDGVTPDRGPDGVTPVHDVSVGDWVRERLLRDEVSWGRVGSLLPTGFPRVVRVLHPPGDGRTWAQVARDAGRIMHPLVQWGSIADHDVSSGRSSDVDPAEGSDSVPVLGAVLAHLPATGDVLHGVWVGYGEWSDSARAFPELVTLHREYYLFAGPARAHGSWPGWEQPWEGYAETFPRTANLVWPVDRSWCVASEIDWDSTVVGCADDVAEALLADPVLETVEVGESDDLTWWGDTLNPLPRWLAGHRPPPR